MKLVIDIPEDKYDLIRMAAISGLGDFTYKIIANGTPLPDSAESEEEDINIYPLCIVTDRYNGTYSGGKYTAWNRYSAPDEAWWDDCGCAVFFSTTDIPYGVGNTPEEAVKNLFSKLKGDKKDE